MSVDWEGRWAVGRIGFHNDQVNPHLATYAAKFAGPRVFVPLCGKTKDLGFLVDQGFAPVGIELVPLAVEQLFAEHGPSPEGVQAESVEVRAGLKRFRGGGLEVFVGDFFDLDLGQTEHGMADAVWDRAALIAIDPADRPRYVERLHAQLKPGGQVLLCTLDYDQAKMEGPPFSLSDDQVEELFESRFDRERLHRGPASLPPRGAGIHVEESVWRLVPKTAPD